MQVERAKRAEQAKLDHLDSNPPLRKSARLLGKGGKIKKEIGKIKNWKGTEF